MIHHDHCWEGPLQLLKTEMSMCLDVFLCLCVRVCVCACVCGEGWTFAYLRAYPCSSLCVFVNAHIFNPPTPAEPTLLWLTAETCHHPARCPPSAPPEKAAPFYVVIGHVPHNSTRSTESGQFTERLLADCVIYIWRPTWIGDSDWWAAVLWAVLQFRLAGSVKPREKVAIEVQQSWTAGCIIAAGSCYYQN